MHPHVISNLYELLSYVGNYLFVSIKRRQMGCKTVDPTNFHYMGKNIETFSKYRYFSDSGEWVL